MIQKLIQSTITKYKRQCSLRQCFVWHCFHLDCIMDFAELWFSFESCWSSAPYLRLTSATNRALCSAFAIWIDCCAELHKNALTIIHKMEENFFWNTERLAVHQIHKSVGNMSTPLPWASEGGPWHPGFWNFIFSFQIIGKQRFSYCLADKIKLQHFPPSPGKFLERSTTASLAKILTTPMPLCQVLLHDWKWTYPMFCVQWSVWASPYL